MLKSSMVLTTRNSENIVPRHSFDKVCVCMGRSVIKNFEGVGRGGQARNFKIFFFLMRSRKWGYKRKKHKGVWETDRVKMKGYTHGLVSQQRNGAGSGGREESLPFLSLD